MRNQLKPKNLLNLQPMQTRNQNNQISNALVIVCYSVLAKK